MPTVVIEITIDGPVELCFDLARDVGVHAESAACSSERIVEPVRMDNRAMLIEATKACTGAFPPPFQVAFAGRH